MYISEGIPYGFTSAAIVAYLRSEGLGLDDIGLFVAALFLPWTFKWAWAPLVDLFRFNSLGGRKAWIVACTTMMVITLGLIQFLDLHNNFKLLLGLVVFSNIFAATQDVAIDSLAVSTLKENERARGNGFMFGGQYAGIAIGGAGSIALFGLIGFNATLAVMCGLLTINLLFIVLFIRDPDVDSSPSSLPLDKVIKNFFRELKVGFLDSGLGPKLALLYSLLPIGAMALGAATLSTMQVDYGLDQAAISQITAINTVLAAAGCLIGGFLGDRFGVRKVLFLAYLGSAIPTLLIGIAISNYGLTGITYLALASAIASHGFIYGIGFGLHAAIFMGVANPAVGATMFTAFMAMSNLTISYTNLWQGQVAETSTYATVLFIDAALVILPLCLIPFLRNREDNQTS